MNRETGDMVIQEEEDGKGPEGGVEVNPVLLQQLMEMGFGENGCKKALIETGGKNVEAAMNWVFGHMGDADFNEPVKEGAAAGGGGGGEEYPEVVGDLMAMGMFQLEHVKVAVKWANGEQAKAADWLFNNMDGIDEKIKTIAPSEEVRFHKARNDKLTTPAMGTKAGRIRLASSAIIAITLSAYP